MARRWPWLAALAIAVLDRATKHWIETRVAEWEAIAVIDGLFRIVHTRNTGVAFSLFAEKGAGQGGWVLTAVTGALTLLMAALLWHACRSEREHWTLPAAFACILAGAAGNLFDRVAFGSVTDFLDFYWGVHHWPAFNVADASITGGAALLLWNAWVSRKAGRSMMPNSAAPERGGKKESRP